MLRIKSRLLERACLLGLAAAFLAVGGGCKQKMSYQPRYDPLERSDSFFDKTSARPAVAGTVARGYLRENVQVFLGRTEDGAYVTEFPFPITEQVMKRGRERYDIYCTMCHGFAGYGNGMIVQRGFSPPPSFHTDETRIKPVGYYFSVITNGYGAMPSHAHQIPVSDRWAIVAYVRALQASQNVRPEDLSAEEREKVMKSAATAADMKSASGTPGHSAGHSEGERK
jgi:mono/diheme cytochrome c family protein